MNIIVTIYPTFSKRIDVHTIPSWKPWSFVYNCLLFLFPKWFIKQTKICYFSSSFYGNRLAPIHYINTAINLSLLTRIANQYRIKVLWIRDPDYYKLHNRVHYSYLVFDCLPKIINDSSNKFLYKNYFSQGWKFCYASMSGDKTTVFKNVRDEIIITTLRANKNL